MQDFRSSGCLSVTSCGEKVKPRSVHSDQSNPIQSNYPILFTTNPPSSQLPITPPQRKSNKKCPPHHPPPPQHPPPASPPPPTQPKTSSNRKPSASSTCPISANDAPKPSSKAAAVAGIVAPARLRAMGVRAGKFLCLATRGFVRAIWWMWMWMCTWRLTD